MGRWPAAGVKLRARRPPDQRLTGNQTGGYTARAGAGAARGQRRSRRARRRTGEEQTARPGPHRELTARRWEAVLNSLSLEVSAHAAALAELVTAESLFGRILVVEVCGSLDMERVDGTVGLPEVKDVVVERPRKGAETPDASLGLLPRRARE